MPAGLDQETEKEVVEDQEDGLQQTENIDDLEEKENEDVVVEIEEAEDAQDEPEDKQKSPEQKKIPRSQKRILQLLDKVNESQEEVSDLKSQLSYLMKAQKSREVVESENSIKQLEAQQIEAMENGEHQKVIELQREAFKLVGPKHNTEESVDPETYFSQINSYYGNESLDPGLKRTRYSKQLSNEIWNDQRFSHMSTKEKLNHISTETNKAFKTNPYKNASPTAGVTTSAPTSTLTITQKDIAIGRQMYPGLTQKELIQELTKNKKFKGATKWQD